MTSPASRLAADPRLALARWYIERMLEWIGSYYQGAGGIHAALRSFDRVSYQIRALQPWLAARAKVDGDAAEICMHFPSAADFMAFMRLDPGELPGLARGWPSCTRTPPRCMSARAVRILLFSARPVRRGCVGQYSEVPAHI